MSVKQALENSIDKLTKEGVEGLLGLTKEEIEAMADLILDTEVRIDKTYSSSKIYTDIQQCLEDSKTYTLEEIAKASTASYKVVTDVVDMIEERYLYLLHDGTTNYDIYIVETDGTPTKIGNTQIDLSNYYTKTKIDNDFLKKVDADSKYATITTVDGKANTTDLTTHTNDTDIHVTTTDKAKWNKVIDKVDTVDFNTHKDNTDIHITSVERTKWNKVDNKINKTDITTTIDSSSTDTQVPSAKSVYDTTSKFLKTYTSLSQLGLTAPITVGEIFNAMPNKTMAILSCEDIADHITDVPIAYGVLTIKKSGVGRFSIDYQNSLFGSPCNVKRWIGTLKGTDGTGLYWKQLSAEPTFVALNDIGLTANATFQDVIDKLPKGGSAILGVKDFTNYQTIFPYEEGNDQFARVHIVKGLEDGSCVYARWFRKDGVKEANAIFNINDNTFSGWKMLKNQQVYTALKELGLDTTATINDIVVAMKNGTTFTYKTDVFDYATEYENLRYATVTIIKQTTGRIQIFMTDKNTGNLYIGKMSSDNKVDGWSKVQTEVEVIITSDIIAKYGTEILKYPVGTWRINNKNIGNQFTDLPLKDVGSVIEIDSIDPNRSPYEHAYGYRNYIFKSSLDGIIYIRTLNSGDTAGTLQRDTGWKKVCTDETRLTTVETQVSELFQSVSNGKTLVANAITGKGVSTSTSATFATMATNISKIPQTITWKEETVSASPNSNTHIARFVFSNTVLGVKQMIAPGYHYTAKVTETKMFTINSNTVEVYLDSGTWKMTAMVRNT